MGKSALIAMSGGVDSSVAAYLMKERGFRCAGATMRLFDRESGGGEASCGSSREIEDAGSVCRSMGMPYHVFDLTDEFERQVIGRFIEAYRRGETPNPCIDCNRLLKFEKLFRKASELEMDYFVTGHYARIEYCGESGRYLLKKAADSSKDQSYVLYTMGQGQLSRCLLPLGELHKSQVREIAREQGFINAGKRDSQDICFVPDGDYASFIEARTGIPDAGGDFINLDGRVLGRHRGLIRYTQGQRKGLGLALERPMYVLSKNIKENTVTLCESEGLFSRELTAHDFNWIVKPEAEGPIRAKAKIRYRHQEQWATAHVLSDGRVQVVFDEPQRAITPGQAVVLYDGDTVLGGGRIGGAGLG